MQKFSDQGPAKQLFTLLGFMAACGLSAGSILLWAADKKIDETYATDADVLAVQERVETVVTEIQTTVIKNTTAVTATSASVDALTLTVLDMQITKIEVEITGEEARKRGSPNSWESQDEVDLLRRKRTLQDFETQRTALFSRLLGRALDGG